MIVTTVYEHYPGVRLGLLWRFLQAWFYGVGLVERFFISILYHIMVSFLIDSENGSLAVALGA